MASSTPPAPASGWWPAPLVARARRTLHEHVGRRLQLWDTPTTSYYVVLGFTICMVVLGLVMVLSSSSATSMAEAGSPFSLFYKQVLFAAVGLPVMWGCSRIPVPVWKQLGLPLVVVAALAQALVVFTSLGVGKGGNKNWIVLGPFTAQPSEAAKLALVVACAVVLARKADRIHRPVEMLLPIALICGVLLGLVLKGHDLGTAMVMMILVASMMFVAGVPLRWFAVASAGGGAVATALILSSPNRIARIGTWLSGDCDRYGACWQSIHGKWALASGGFWGLGLGASREKYDWLPEAHNDYIYAIIGEELGLPGTLTLLLLLVLLAFAGMRIIQRHDDLFVKIATAGVLGWVIGQGLMNIGVVLGMLPVIGVPLPLVSSGGSALISTLAALGLLLAFARSEPGAEQALAARVGRVRHSLTRIGHRRSS